MYNWTKEEKEIVDLILEKDINGELTYDEAAEMAESHGIDGWRYKRYSLDECVRRYNEDFYKYMGKIKKEALNSKFEPTEEEKRILRENPDDLSLMIGIMDNVQRKSDSYEIEQAKYYYRVAKSIMEDGYDDKFVKEIVPLTDEAIKEIREAFVKERNDENVDRNS